MITIIVGVFTVISGFYGMNFLQTWPPFDAPWGVPFVLALPASASFDMNVNSYISDPGAWVADPSKQFDTANKLSTVLVSPVEPETRKARNDDRSAER
jgi:hypothetical protein